MDESRRAGLLINARARLGRRAETAAVAAQ